MYLGGNMPLLRYQSGLCNDERLPRMHIIAERMHGCLHLSHPITAGYRVRCYQVSCPFPPPRLRVYQGCENSPLNLSDPLSVFVSPAVTRCVRVEYPYIKKCIWWLFQKPLARMSGRAIGPMLTFCAVIHTVYNMPFSVVCAVLYKIFMVFNPSRSLVKKNNSPCMLANVRHQLHKVNICC